MLLWVFAESTRCKLLKSERSPSSQWSGRQLLENPKFVGSHLRFTQSLKALALFLVQLLLRLVLWFLIVFGPTISDAKSHPKCSLGHHEAQPSLSCLIQTCRIKNEKFQQLRPIIADAHAQSFWSHATRFVLQFLAHACLKNKIWAICDDTSSSHDLREHEGNFLNDEITKLEHSGEFEKGLLPPRGKYDSFLARRVLFRPDH